MLLTGCSLHPLRGQFCFFNNILWRQVFVNESACGFSHWFEPERQSFTRSRLTDTRPGHRKVCGRHISHRVWVRSEVVHWHCSDSCCSSPYYLICLLQTQTVTAILSASSFLHLQHPHPYLLCHISCVCFHSRMKWMSGSSCRRSDDVFYISCLFWVKEQQLDAESLEIT